MTFSKKNRKRTAALIDGREGHSAGRQVWDAISVQIADGDFRPPRHDSVVVVGSGGDRGVMEDQDLARLRTGRILDHIVDVVIVTGTPISRNNLVALICGH